MKELRVEQVSHDIGTKKLYDDISLSIKENRKIGLIGVNGTGKTTLLDIIAQQLVPDKGRIIKPSDYYIGYLNQNSVFSGDKTVLETVYEGETPIMKAVRHYEIALKALTENAEDKKAQNRFSKAEELMNQVNAWNANAEAKTILNKLGITDMDAKMSEQSGGQVKRVMLAQVLIQSPDLLILDEPTNHLDYEMIQWLESFVRDYKGSVLLVSHDRYFLNNTVDAIVEIRHKKLFSYPGNYQKYVLLKSEEEQQATEARHKNKQLYKKELAWMREGVRARGTKQKARIERFKDVEKEAIQSHVDDDLSMSFQHQRLGNKVIELEDASLTFNNQTILDHFNLLVQNRDRIGITGENGSGKSTLLNVITGQIPLDSGIIELGETVRIGYYTQTNIGMDENMRVISYLQDTAEEVKTADGSTVSVSQLLEQFLFDRKTHGTIIKKLSGGEKRRLYLLNILMQQPNVLLLDEPTNDLDIQTLTILEDYLETFSGAVLTISHDRYFLDKVAHELLIFQGGGRIDRYVGRMSDYLKTLKKETSSIQVVKPSSVSDKEKTVDEKTRLNYHEQQEWKTIEDDMFTMDARIEEIKADMLHYGNDLGKLQELETERVMLETQLDEKIERWEYLSQFVKE